MNAAEPHLTSKTKEPNPSAAFFEIIDAVINGILSMVLDTSLMA